MQTRRRTTREDEDVGNVDVLCERRRNSAFSSSATPTTISIQAQRANHVKPAWKRGSGGELTRSTRDPQNLLRNILRHEGLQPLVHLLGRVGVAAEPRHRELGLDHARADVAHADVVADEFAEEGAGKGRDGVFWGPFVQVQGVSPSSSSLARTATGRNSLVAV